VELALAGHRHQLVGHLVGISTLIGVVARTGLGLVLYLTGNRLFRPNPALNSVVGVIVNAIQFGYNRYETGVLIAIVVVLIVIVQIIQWLGDWVARRLTH
ncbi:MAG: hypothetical protein ACTMHX_07560, partial [Bifidobacterium mongoliense]